MLQLFAVAFCRLVNETRTYRDESQDRDQRVRGRDRDQDQKSVMRPRPKTTRLRLRPVQSSQLQVKVTQIGMFHFFITHVRWMMNWKWILHLRWSVS